MTTTLPESTVAEFVEAERVSPAPVEPSRSHARETRTQMQGYAVTGSFDLGGFLDELSR